MKKDPEFLIEVDGKQIPQAQLAAMDAGKGFSNPEFLAQAPDGMIARFHFDDPDYRILGQLKLPFNVFLPVAEAIYEQIKLKNKTPEDAGAFEVEEKFGNTWPLIDELLQDSELWIDAFENYLFDLLRLIICVSNTDTRYIVQAVSSECIISEDNIELHLALVERFPDSKDRV